MSKIKLCGMWRDEDIETVNELLPDYTGFVFWEKSRRYVSEERAKTLKGALDKRVLAAGVFLDEEMHRVEKIANDGIIDIIQLHGHEDEGYIKRLRECTDKPIIKAFVIKDKSILDEVMDSSADYVLIDSGAGSGKTFDWELLEDIKRPYFLAGGLSAENVSYAIEKLDPFAVDVSSGLETDGKKDPMKMKRFVEEVRNVR